MGLVVGLGMGAGVYYYEHIVAAAEARGEVPRLLLAHADFRTVQSYLESQNIEGLRVYLASIAESLANAGCSSVAISAVTPHICIAELQAGIPIPFVNMLQSISDELRRRNMRRVSLFGSRYVIASDLFGALSGIECVRARPEETTAIGELYQTMAARGHGTEDEFAALTRIGERLYVQEKLDAIALAGTDLAELFDSRSTPFPVVDSSQIHIRDIVEQMLT